MSRLWTFFLAAVLSLVAVPMSGSDVDSLRINVELRDNGSAIVTETWHIDVSDDITEWYLVADNMGQMTIEDLVVSDETIGDYLNEGEWDVDRSRAMKAGRCGLVTKSNGYEICWGVGSSGRHTYTVRYLLTGLVKGHEDMDGFNHMFVARNLGSSPKSIILTVRKAGMEFSTENTKVWAFGFRGEIHVENGIVVARTTEPFIKESAMIVMVGFEKGMFHPDLVEKRTFDQVRKKALKGSDYSSSGEYGFWEWASVIFFAIIVILVFLTLIAAIKDKINKIKRKKELLGGRIKDVPWYRDTPVNGDLRKASNILTEFEGLKSTQRQNLIAAYITRLFLKGGFEIVQQPGGSKPQMLVKDLPDTAAQDDDNDTKLESELHSFIKEAAGDDRILQKNELRRWSKYNGRTLYAWSNRIENGATVWTMKPEEVRQVFGLRKFLKDFTLIKDRGVVEVKLWNDYLVFASLYGIADQVMRDFRKVCPEYFRLSSSAEFFNDSATNLLIWDMINMTSRDFSVAASTYEASLNSSSSSGGGGSSSWGGGGGYSGGGSGGGGR